MQGETLFSSVTTIVLGVAWAVVIFASEPPKGFRGIPWGAKVSQIAEDIESGRCSQDEICTYTRKQENLKIGAATVSSVSYGFYTDKFYFAKIAFHGRANLERIEEALEHLYGRPSESGVHGEPYVNAGPWRRWNFAKVVVSVSYAGYFLPADTGVLDYVYLPIQSEANSRAKQRADREKRERLKKAAKDLAE